MWKYAEIARFYDVETLTEEKIVSEIKRLEKEIKEFHEILLFLEEHDKKNPEKLKFYEERDNKVEQLDAINGFLADLKQEQLNEFSKDTKLRSLYSKLPEWRIQEKRKAEKDKKLNFYRIVSKL